MKAIVAPRAGASHALTLHDVPVPGLDPGEVLVRLRAIGVGLHDRWFMPPDARYPYPIGIEGAGVVERVGEGASRLRPGDRVLFVSSAQPKGGTWAEFAAVPERDAVLLPDALDFVHAAALPVAGGTALASVEMLRLAPEDTVFMAGASGAIGTLAIQLARLAGARVAASASARNHAYLRSLGAEWTVDYREPDWPEQVRAWQSGGTDAALAIQPGTGTGCLRVLRDGGRLVTVSGDKVPSERNVSVAQVLVGPDTRARLAELARDVAAGRVHVEIERTYPFEQGLEALEKTETRRARGKVVLTLG